ncbi:MAG: type 4a pilus biogenesis protein PilO [bacterium]
MNKSAKTSMVTLAVILAVCCGWYFLLYRPKVLGLDQLKQRSEQLLTKVSGYQITDAALAAMETQLEQKRKALQAKQAKLLSKEELQAAVAGIKRCGERLGLRFQRIIPDYTSLTSLEAGMTDAVGVRKLVVHLTMRGRYKTFGNFLHALTALPFLVSLGEIHVVYHQGWFPDLELSVDTELFLTDKREVWPH